MALVPSFAASEIFLALRAIAGLDADGNAIYIPPPPPPVDIPAVWAEEYNSYAKMGVIPGAENTGSNTAGIEAAIRAGVNNNEDEIKELALVMLRFWYILAVTPSDPAHGGTEVVSVTNDAMLHVGAFETAVRSSMTSSRSEPFFQVFVENVQNIGVAAITWVVTEVVLTPAPVPTDFPEKIS